MPNDQHSNTAPRRSRWVPLLAVVLTPVYYFVPWERLGSGGAFAGIPFLVLYAVLLPGAGISAHLFPRATDVLDRLIAAALTGMTFFLGVAFVWALTGTPLGMFRLLLPVALIVAAAACYLPRPATGRALEIPVTGHNRFLLGAFALFLVWVFVVVLRSGIPPGFRADTLDHVAYVAEIRDTQSAFPTTEFYLNPGSNGEDLRKGLLHVFYGFGVSYLGVSPVGFLDGINAFFAVILLLSVYSAALLLFQNRTIAVLAAFVFLIGVDMGLDGTMIRQSFYSHRFGMAFYLFALAHSLRFMENGHRRELAPAAWFAFAACATHVFFGLIVGFSALAILAWKICFPQNTYRVHIHRSVMLGIALFAGVFPFGIYRYMTAFPEPNELHAGVQGVMFLTQHLYVAEPSNTYRWFGPIGILTFVAIIPMWRQRGRYAALGYVIASFFTVVVLAYNPVLLPPLRNTITYLIARLDFLCPFYLGTAYFLVTVLSPDRSAERRGMLAKILAVLMLIAVLDAVRPVVGGTSFSRKGIAAERENSYMRWDKELEQLERTLPPQSVVATDPMTAYSITAFTPLYVVCTFDQHAPPNDVMLAGRMQAARDILSPYVSIAATVDLLARHHAKYIVLNDRFPSNLMLEYWLMDSTVFPLARHKFESHPALFKTVLDEKDFVVFEWTGERPAGTASEERPFVLDRIPAGFSRVGGAAGQARLEAFAVGDTTVTPGGRVRLRLVWRGEGPYRFGNYVVVTRFDNTDPGLPFGGRPFDKIARKFKEMLIGRLYRFTSFHKIRNGFLGPDTWRPGDLVLDEFGVSVPLNVEPGRYRVSIKLMTIAHQSTYWVRDLLLDNDIYEGIPITTVTVE